MRKRMRIKALRTQWIIHLESAAFVFHMMGTTQGVAGSLRAACSEPLFRSLACPFSQQKPTPQTRGCLCHRPAPGLSGPGADLCNGKKNPFDLLSRFRLGRTDL